MDVVGFRQRREATHGGVLMRAILAEVLDRVQPDGASAYLERCSDRDLVKAVHKAAVSPGTTGAAGWGAELMQTVVADFIGGLGPMSAAAQLFAQSIQPPYPKGEYGLQVPGCITEAAGAFIAEGDPMPVVSPDLSAATLHRRTLGMIAIISRELAKMRGAEATMNQLITEAASLTLDNLVFSSTAATSAAPAGLLYGLTPISPDAIGGDAIVDAFTALAAAVGGSRLAYVVNPARAVQISMLYPMLRYPVLVSSSVASARVVAVSLDALAVTIDPVADLSVSTEAVVHMSDDPDPIVSGTAADPVRSLYQTAALGIRLMLGVDWAKRRTNAVAFVDGF